MVKVLSKRQLKAILEQDKIEDKDFSRVNFNGMQLTERTFTNCKFPEELTNVSLENSVFIKVDGKNSTFMNCNFTGSRFVESNFENTAFRECQFDKAHMYGNNFNNSIFFTCFLRHVEMGKNNFKTNGFDQCYFDYARGVQNDFEHTHFTKSSLLKSNILTMALSIRRCSFTHSKVPATFEITPITNFRKVVLKKHINSDTLNMRTWHTCHTVHCLAGWICHLHPQGKLLESIFSPQTAASLILAACGETIPDFFDMNTDHAFEWINK